MKRVLERTCMAAVCASGVALAGCNASQAAAPASAAAADERLIFAEEFDDGALDRSKWNVEGPTFHVNDELQAYVDSPQTVTFAKPSGATGGALVLRPVFEPGFKAPDGRTADFFSGRIDTRHKFELTYGKVAARIRLPAATGIWPAFWMLGYGEWPDCGETDIMENVGDPAWTNAAMHGPGYSGETPLVKRQYFPAGVDVTQWHEYAVERTPDAVAFSVDGHEFYRVTRAEVERYGRWRYDRPQYVILNLALGGIYPHKVNAIEKPYYGMPQSTVDRIRAGQIGMEVDWVRAWSAK